MLRLFVAGLCLLALTLESVAQVTVLPGGRFKFRAKLVLDSVRRYEAIVSFPTPKGEVSFRQYSTAIVSELWDGKAYVVCRQTDFEIVGPTRPKFPAPSGKFEKLVLLDSSGELRSLIFKGESLAIENILKQLKANGIQDYPPAESHLQELLWLFPLPEEQLKKGARLSLGSLMPSLGMVSRVDGEASFLGWSRKGSQVCARFSMSTEKAADIVSGAGGSNTSVGGKGDAWIRASDGFLEAAEFEMEALRFEAMQRSWVRIPYRVVIRRILGS